MAVPKPTGLYLRTWMVYSGKTSPLSRCRLDSGPQSLLGLGLVLGEAVEGVGSPSLLGLSPSLIPFFTHGECLQNYPKKAYSGY